jgi:hypothetical protein
VARENPVSVLATVTSAPARTAPVASVTVPWMPPRKVWANKVEERQSIRTKEKNPEERVLIVNRPLKLRLAWRENYTARSGDRLIARDRRDREKQNFYHKGHEGTQRKSAVIEKSKSHRGGTETRRTVNRETKTFETRRKPR